MSQKFNAYNSRLKLLALIGAAISTWLFYHHVEVNGGYQQGASFCDISALFNCTSVARSDYSEFLGVPVAGWSLWYYVALLLLLCIPKVENESEQQSYAAFILFFIVAGLLPTLLLAGISFFQLGAICSMCASLYLLNILLFVLAFRNPALRLASSSRAALFQQYLTTSLPSTICSIGGVAAASVLLVLAPLIVASTSLLTFYYFEPRVQKLHAESSLAPIYAKWRKAKYSSALEQIVQDSPNSDFYKGAEDAQLTLVEFSDFQCPHCAKAAKTLSIINSELSKNVKIVFKNFPLDAACNDLIPQGHGHSNACRAARMARCAGEQDRQKFWQMHDALFVLDSWSDESLEMLAEELLLDTVRFEQCMQNVEVVSKIKADIKLGLESGVQGTPSFFLNGRRLEIFNLQIIAPFLKYVIAKQEEKAAE